jgi:hypothetical protein
LGERNGFDKRYMWDESIRAPCVVRYPRRIAPGTVVPAGVLLQPVDWAPTLLELAHVTVRLRPRVFGDDAAGATPYASTVALGPAPATAAAPPPTDQAGGSAAAPTPLEPARTIGFHGRPFTQLLLAPGEPPQGSGSGDGGRWALRDAVYYRYYGAREASTAAG